MSTKERRRGYARDEIDEDDKTAQAAKFLKSRLSDEDWATFKQLMKGNSEGSEAEDDEDRSAEEQTQRESRRDWGRESRVDELPRPGGKMRQVEDRRMASDAKPNGFGFEKLWSRIGHV